tara:strand:+ start:113 stop:1498 length:1386 start_codon:yes stop_codon:yes gene_type:complete
MTKYLTIIVLVGLGLSQDEEFIYSTLIDTSFGNNYNLWTEAVYKFNEQGLSIEQLIPARSRIEDMSENQSKILFTSGDSIMLYDEGLIEYLNLIGSEPSFIYNGDIVFRQDISDSLYQLHRFSFEDSVSSLIVDSLELIDMQSSYKLSSNKQNVVFFEKASLDSVNIKIVNVVSGFQTFILKVLEIPWIVIYWANNDYLYLNLSIETEFGHQKQLFRIHSSGIDEQPTQLTFLESGFNLIETKDSHLDKIIGISYSCFSTFFSCYNKLFSFSFETNQIQHIGSIKKCHTTIFHSWSHDNEKVALGTYQYCWSPLPGFIKVFNLSNNDSSIIGEDIYGLNPGDWLSPNRMKIFWVDGQNNVSLSETRSLPNRFKIHQNYPNPFNPTTTLEYELPLNTFVQITIYDMLGNVVNHLVNEAQTSGYKSVIWNATNNLGHPVSAGVYIYNIEAGDFRQTKKMILLK